jgi:methyltransferase (TIGR00027 family)
MSTSTETLSGVHHTAFMAAALRAGHYLRGAEPKIFADEFAPQLLEMGDTEIEAFYARVPPHLASTCVLRSRFTEERLAHARTRLNQYVVLGAGLDSYGLRQGDSLGEMIVFEVDDPPFQNWKRQRIDALGLNAPRQVHYVPCDFERMSVAEALAAQGFKADEPAFVSWLGVTQYLTRDAIRETLKWAGARPKGSEIIVTVVEPAAYEEGANRRGGVVDFTSYISVEEMSDMLREAGFNTIEPLTLATAQKAYFDGRTDGLTLPQHQRTIAAVI